MSYDVFLNLEVANRQELFRSDANSERYGLHPGSRSSINPDDCRSASARRPLRLQKKYYEVPTLMAAAS